MTELKFDKLEWDLTPLLNGFDDPEIGKKREEVKKVNLEFAKKWKDRKDYLEEPKALKEALDEVEKISSTCGSSGDEGYYTALRYYNEQDNPEIKARYAQIEEFSRKLGDETRFFMINLSKIAENKQKEFLEARELEEYRHMLEELFKASKHVLSEKEEKIMSLKSKTSYDNWVMMLEGLMAKEEREVLQENGERKIVPFETISKLTKSHKKEVRDDAVKAFNSIMEELSPIAEAELNSVLENKRNNDGLRGYKSAEESRLLGEEVDKEVIDAMLEAVKKAFSLSEKYYGLKAKLLGQGKLEYHERNVPYGHVNELDYSFEESSKMVSEVFKELDSEFNDIFVKMLNNGQIDVYPRKGKMSGARMFHNYKSQPCYIQLNHLGSLNDVTVIAHEMGHAINFELSRVQNAFYFDTSLATTEVASTFMEDFVLERVLKDANDEMKLSILVERLNDDISSIIRQSSFYLFERELHEKAKAKGYLSKEEIGEIFQKHMKNYMGKFVEQSPGSENWWVYIPHFRDCFYVFSYASGLLISKALQAKVKEDNNFIEKVKEFLRAGTSASPKDIFDKTGIDITDEKFWELGIKEIEKTLEEVEELAKKLGKI